MLPKAPHPQPPRLYAITDERFVTPSNAFAALEAALLGGCRWVQFRHKSLGPADALAQAKALKALCQPFNATFIVNDNPQLALACQAHGVHLGQTDMPIKQARALLGPNAIIGATCHQSLALAHQAAAEGASYVAFGRFFASGTKPLASAAPLSLLPQLALLPLPSVVIGGISLANAPRLLQGGARSLAVCEGLFNTADIRQQALAFLALPEA